MTQTTFPITRERHGEKKWLRFKNLSFATEASLTPVGISETLNAARVFPLGFVEIAGRLSLSAIMGLKAGQNLFVGANGRWLAQHLPIAFQHYPFSLGKAGDQNNALFVDEASGLLIDNAVGEEGFPVFDAEGNATAETKQVLEQLGTARRGFEVVQHACAVIAAKGLLEPWPVVYKENDKEIRIEGIQRISEPALNALPAAELVALREAGGLAIAYCQLFSIGNVGTLMQLMAARAKAVRERMTVPQHSFTPQEDDNLKIDWNLFLQDK